jgi:hypothetical protein
MNGIIFNKPIQEDPSGTFLEQVKKNEETKKRKNLKYIFTVLVSNICVAMIFYTPAKEIINDVNTSPLVIHTGFRMMTLNISPLVQIDQVQKENRISLLNSKKKIVLSLGYLHEEIKNDQDPSTRRFNIEIPEKQTLEISSFADEKLVAIPAIEIKKTANNFHQGSKYEVNL